MSFSECMKLVARMSQSDQAELIERVDDYIASGIAPGEAQRMAGQDMLSEIEVERSEIVGLADAQDIPALSKAEPTPEESAPEPVAGPGFYSALRRELSKAKTNASPAEYWNNLIKGAVNKGSVKADELKWSGLGDWLKGQEGKVKKTDVLAWLDDNGTKVTETVLGGAEKQVTQADIDAAEARGDWGAYDRLTAQYEDQQLGNNANGTGNETRFGKYVVPGGSNYREVLLTLPEKAIDPYADADTLADQLDARRASTYKSPHWDQPNVLVHLRVDDHVDADGKKVLFVNEIQSDWGQQGKKEGFDNDAAFKRLVAARDAAPDDSAQQEELQRQIDAMGAGSSKGVPSAPFVTKTGAWVDLALKRVITMAVDGGYDKIAFANGEQNADHYDLSKQVDRIHYEKDDAGKYELIAYKAGSQDDATGSEVLHEDEISLDRVEALVGKEIAQKIADEAGESIGGPYRNWRELKGVSLKVGHAGMRAFYDSIVPKAANALLKKLGGGKLYVPSERGRDVTLNGAAQFDITPELRAKVEQEGLPLFSRAEGEVGWKIDDDSRITRFIYNLQDKNVDLRDTVKAIKSVAGELRDRENADLRETLFLGRVTNRQRRFLDEELKPLTTLMAGAGLSFKDLGEYLHARHAEERNAAMKAINPDRVDNEALSGMSDDQARKILASARPALPAIAARVDAIIAGTRSLYEVAGLETPEFVQTLRDAYANYIPLMRDEAHPDHRMAQGQGFSVKGSNVKRATGSTAEVDHELIMAHIAEAREVAIVRAEKNLVAMSVYALAKQNPNPDFWKTDDPPQISTIDTRKEIYNPGTKQMMANPKYNTVVQRTDPMYKSQDNVLIVRVNGEDRSIQFNEHDPRALRMAASLKNLDVEKLGTFLGLTGKATRYLAAINTQYNPVFAITNNIRDVQEAMVNLSSTGIKGKRLQVLADTYSHAIVAVGRVETQGKAATGEWADLYRELAARGGLTGYRESFDTINDRFHSIRQALDKQTESGSKSAALAAPRAIGGAVSVLNTSIENSVRLAVYKAALDAGKTKDQAAVIAKEITVNFNRKGAKTAEVGALYAFFNAAVQGTTRTLRTLNSPAGKLIIGGAMLAGFLQAVLLGAEPDDEEENIKEFTKDLNWVFPIPDKDGKYLSIPMAQGLKPLVGLGRRLGEIVIAAKDGKRLNLSKHAMGLVTLAMDSYNPLGNSPNPWQMIAPTTLKPVVQLAENKNWTGEPVYRERGPYGQFKSGSSLGRDSTAAPYKWAAEAINKLTGGTNKTRNAALPAALSPHPEALRLLTEAVGGGVLREVSKLFEYAASKTGSDKEAVDDNRIPLFGRFLVDTRTDSAPAAKFYANLDDIESLAKRQKDLADSGDQAAADKIETTSPEVKLAGEAKNIRQKLTQIRSARREAAIAGQGDRELRTYDKQVAELMRGFNKDYREIAR